MNEANKNGFLWALRDKNDIPSFMSGTPTKGRERSVRGGHQDAVPEASEISSPIPLLANH